MKKMGRKLLSTLILCGIGVTSMGVFNQGVFAVIVDDKAQKIYDGKKVGEGKVVSLTVEDVSLSREKLNKKFVSAVMTGTKEEVALLLKQGADPNSSSSTGNPALSWAAEIRDLRITQLLLDSGAHVNAKNSSGFTALHWAVMNIGYKLDCVKELLLRGADIDARVTSGHYADHTPLQVAQKYYSKEREAIIKLLTEAEAAKANGDQAYESFKRSLSGNNNNNN